MAIRIRRSSGDTAPASLTAGQLAYTEGSTNGGTLYYGEIGGTVREIAGRKFVDKLNGIEAGAEVNVVSSVAGKTGAIALVATDIGDFNTAADTRIAAAVINDLSNVQGTPSDGQVLTYNFSGGYWEPQASPTGVTSFIALNDTPVAYTGAGNYWVRVNGSGTALEFTQDLDDGTF